MLVHLGEVETIVLVWFALVKGIGVAPLFPVTLPGAAAQAGETGGRQGPVGFRIGHATPNPKHGVGPG